MDWVRLARRWGVWLLLLACGNMAVGGGLLGAYYAERDFTAFAYYRVDPEINFDWKSGGPVELGDNGFSMRWIGHVIPEFSEAYTFITATDDGVRLWIDHRLLVDEWHGQAIAEHSGKIELEAGRPYLVQMEYYENSGSAAAKLLWSSPSQPKGVIPADRLLAPGLGQGFLAQYFATQDLTESQSIRLDEVINFKAGNRWPPVAGTRDFGVRWTAKLVPRYSEDYTFKVLASGGVRVSLAGDWIIDSWERHAMMADSAIVECTAQRLQDLVFEFRGKDQDCVRLLWSSESQDEEMVPTSVLIPVGTGTGFKTQIYNDMELTELVTTRIDPTINFSFATGEARADGLTGNSFSGRWIGNVVPLFSESYTFAIRSDDGVRLWIDGTKVIDSWERGISINHATVDLEAGKPIAFRLEYFDGGGDAILGVKWASPRQPRRFITPRLVYPPDAVSRQRMRDEEGR